MAQAWLIRSSLYGDKTNYSEEFISKGYVALGPNSLPNLRGMNVDKIRAHLKTRVGDDKLIAGALAATANNFVNKMKVGDLALLIDGNTVYALEIISDYDYVVTKYVSRVFLCHRRSIKVLNRYERDALSDGLRLALKSGRQVADISKCYDEVHKLCYDVESVGKQAESKVKSVEVSYPLRPDYQVKFTLPADMSKMEAERLDAFIRSLYYRE